MEIKEVKWNLFIMTPKMSFLLQLIEHTKNHNKMTTSNAVLYRTHFTAQQWQWNCIHCIPCSFLRASMPKDVTIKEEVYLNGEMSDECINNSNVMKYSTVAPYKCYWECSPWYWWKCEVLLSRDVETWWKLSWQVWSNFFTFFGEILV